jgi:D-serine deaminase-like pyridoxal phosphate-dependent protein
MNRVASGFGRKETPRLLLDPRVMERNIARMRGRIAAHGVALRPHVKTAKSIEVARHMFRDGPAAGAPAEAGPITVSTLLEADQFAGHGFTDILYAVGITPNKLPHVRALRDRGVSLTIVLDSVEAALAVVAAAEGAPRGRAPQFDVMLEIDTDGHRSGIAPDDERLLAVAGALRHPGVRLTGVMTHAGSSYDCTSTHAIRAVAEQERAGAVRAATRLRAAGFPCPAVSVGSTPTATFAERLDGVTEVRAGVYVFFDLVMAGLGVCTLDDIAISVLTSVIGHQREKGWTIVDAGWMAMSRDRGTATQAVDQGYGVVCDERGRALDGFIMSGANQEHGIVAHRSGDPSRMLDAPVGTLLRILPNHACATAAQHGAYQVLGESGRIETTWARFNGW